MRVFNAEPHLREALDSLFAQTFTDFELVAVAGASTDRSLDILASYDDPRVRRVPDSIAGKAGAAMSGLREARGELIAILDADDRWHPDRLTEHVALFDADPKLVLAGSATRIIDPDGNAIGLRKYPLTDAAIRRAILFYNPFAHSAVTYRRAPAIAADGYVPDKIIEDYGLWLRLMSAGTGANLERTLCDYRVRVQTPDTHVRYVLAGTREIRKTAFESFGYKRTIATRACDLALLVLSRLPARLVENVFRLAFYRLRG